MFERFPASIILQIVPLPLNTSLKFGTFFLSDGWSIILLPGSAPHEQLIAVKTDWNDLLIGQLEITESVASPPSL